MKRLLLVGAAGAMASVVLMQQFDVPWDPTLLLLIPLLLACGLMALDPVVLDRDQQLLPYYAYVALAGVAVAAT